MSCAQAIRPEITCTTYTTDIRLHFLPPQMSECQNKMRAPPHRIDLKPLVNTDCLPKAGYLALCRWSMGIAVAGRHDPDSKTRARPTQRTRPLALQLRHWLTEPPRGMSVFNIFREFFNPLLRFS
jgi:hypothetical protein